MAMTRPQPLADHTSIIKRTAENFPKTALASIQLMCLIAKTNQAKGQEALDFVLTMIGRLEDENHFTVVKEVLSLTNRYQPILTINVINKLSALESGKYFFFIFFSEIITKIILLFPFRWIYYYGSNKSTGK